MKKQNLIKTLVLMVSCAFVLTGCASMTYSGEDYNAANAGKVQTDEGFYFSTYKKSSPSEKIDMEVGMTKSSLQDVIAVFVKLTNNNQNSYVVYNKNFTFSQESKKLQTVTPAQFINAYQSQQTGTYAGMSAIAPTIATIATISNNFQTDGSNAAVTANNTQKSLNAQIENFVDGITKYSLANVAVFKPGETKYFYLFVQSNSDVTAPVSMVYKDVAFTFKGASSAL